MNALIDTKPSGAANERTNSGHDDRRPMTFRSVLFPDGATAVDQSAAEPGFFRDLNLDQIVAAITKGREEYDLTAFFHAPLDQVDHVAYRQEVMRDLEDAALISRVKSFAESMRTVRAYLAKVEQLTHLAEKQRWFVDAAELYCDAVADLVDYLSQASVASRGLWQLRQYAAEYAASDEFRSRRDEAKQVKAELATIRYRLHILQHRVEMLPYDGCDDYSKEVEGLFARFRQGDVEPYTFASTRSDSLNKVELMILDRVVQKYPEVFARLDAFFHEHQDFQDGLIADFDRQVQFYVAYLDYIGRFRSAGLRFCYPRVSHDSKETHCSGSFDLALAGKLAGEEGAIVANDFDMSGDERMVVVTGPNQGGKTTFARAFGQAHYLASLGCPVPGRRARFLLCDRIFTHFERKEEIADLSGKLKEDLARIAAILDEATPRSLVVVNEIFSSTSLRDAIVLSRKIAERLNERDLLCVWVTFVDELAAHGDQTVSMVSTVEPERPEERTYRIIRRPADGLAYAMSVAHKHGLTRNQIDERLRS